MSTAEESQVATRDPTGRFIVGCPLGPGRPTRLTEKSYIKALSDECSLDDWRTICRRAVQDAVRGDRYARDWISKFLVGSTTLNMSLTAGEWAVVFTEERGASTLSEDDLESEGLQPRLLSPEDAIVSLAIWRTMARTQAVAETAEQQDHDVQAADAVRDV